MARLSRLLALACLGSAGVLLGGRALLGLVPPLDPNSSSRRLTLLSRLATNPELRRDARLLLLDRHRDNPARQRRLLRGQGWGSDPLAALVLKRDALAAQALGDERAAEQLWQRLWRRFPQTPAAADALYALGRRQPALHEELRRRFPAHPAALAAALEAGPAAAERRDGALHLARHGVRWPGAAALLQQVCTQRSAAPDPRERDLLAGALAQLGEGDAARSCLGGAPPRRATRLALAKNLLHGDPGAQAQGESALLQLSRSAPRSAEARAAVDLLSEQQGSSSLAALDQLPAALQATAPVQARRALEQPGSGAVQAVLRRWPHDPASWELQWQRARQALLQGQWATAASLLSDPIQQHLPMGLAGRQRFWLGYSQWQLGQRSQAQRSWATLLERHPDGYYGWRAAERLGRGGISLDPRQHPALPTSRWQPLDSGDPELDRLWRLNQPLEAWEHWRSQRRQPPTSPKALVLEGRLRRGVGDDWIGLGQLEQASLRLPATPAHCALAQTLTLSLQSPGLAKVLTQAAATVGLPPSLLAAVAQQESRFSPGVHSPAGAVGLLQLLPSTAGELAGRPLTAAALSDPALNARLGGLYLKQLQQQWQGNPVLMAASYNAGPGAVAGWLSPQLQHSPELWIEAIPYPETRLYVKKVLGNLWNLQQQPRARC